MEYNQQQEAIKAAKERETLRLRAMQEKMADKQAADMRRYGEIQRRFRGEDGGQAGGRYAEIWGDIGEI